MATAESFVPPPVDGGAHQRTERRMNASPHPAQSKRDKKRQQLLEKINAVSEKITSKDRDRIYREQLQKIQVDTNLVMGVDPYAERPLDGIGEDRERLQSLAGMVPELESSSRLGPRSLLEMAGPSFQQWAHVVDDLVEERDFEITKQKVNAQYLPRTTQLLDLQ